MNSVYRELVRLINTNVINAYHGIDKREVYDRVGNAVCDNQGTDKRSLYDYIDKDIICSYRGITFNPREHLVTYSADSSYRTFETPDNSTNFIALSNSYHNEITAVPKELQEEALARSIDSEFLKDIIHTNASSTGYNNELLVSLKEIYARATSNSIYNEFLKESIYASTSSISHYTKEIFANRKELYGEAIADSIYNEFLKESIQASTASSSHYNEITIVPKELQGEASARVANGERALITTAATILLNRLNSNIYKSIFPETVINLDFITLPEKENIVSSGEIKQSNHGLRVNDVVAYNFETGYFKPVATKDIQNIVGIVSEVKDQNTFILASRGKLSYSDLSFTDTTILYLSDKIPGKMTHYKDIGNMVYIPIAVYTGSSIIINILDGASGAPLAPYEKPESIEDFEPYSLSELQDVITAVIGE